MELRNPANMHNPLGYYSHQAEVNENARWLLMSGQIGMDEGGSVPEDVISQTALALDNVLRNLAAAGMDKTNLVKLIYYYVGPVDMEKRRDVIVEKLGEHQPCATMLYIAGLANEAWRVEIDAWACREL